MQFPRFLILLLLSAPIAACAGRPAPATGAPPRSPSAERRAQAEDFATRGRAAAEAGDSVRAEQYLSLAIERGASERELLPALLSVCLSSSRLRAALNHASAYLQKDPEDAQLRYLVASIHLSLGQVEESRGALELLLSRSPENTDAQYLLGVVESEVRPVLAAQRFRTYLQSAPRGRHAAEVRSRLSELLIRAQHESERAADEQALLNERGPLEPPPTALPDGSSKTWFDVRAPRAERSEGSTSWPVRISR